MPTPLLNPDNRLLSWSIGDLGLYGAALAPATIIPGEPVAAKGIEAGATQPSLGDGASAVARPNDVAGPVGNDPLGGATPLEGIGGSGALQPADLQPPTVFSLSAPVMQPSDSAPGVPAPVGSGSIATAFPLPPAPFVGHGDVAGTAPDQLQSSFDAPTLPSFDAVPGGGLTVPIAAIAAAVDAVMPVQATTVALDPALDTLDGVAQTAAAAVDAGIDDVAIVASTAGDAVSGIVETLDGTLQGAVGTTDAVSDAVGGVAAAAGPVLDGVSDVAGDALEPATTTVTAAVADVVDALAAAPSELGEAPVVGGAANDLLDGVGGSDPVGGVTTLVSMVSNADEFDLSHVTSPVADTGSIVDSLLVDTPDVPLLGDTDATDDTDDGHIGLFGL